MKSKILCGTDNPVGEAVFLGRTIRMTDRGIEVEGDEKHSNVLIKEWNLSEGKGVETPWPDEDNLNDENRPELPKAEAKLFRRAAARINYMALGRVDLGHASKELSKHMARPLEGDDRKIKIIIRYLVKYHRMVSYIDYQEITHNLDLYTDSGAW